MNRVKLEINVDVNQLAEVCCSEIDKHMKAQGGKMVEFNKGGRYTYEIWEFTGHDYIVMKKPAMGGNMDGFRAEPVESEDEAQSLMDKWILEEFGAKK